MPLDEDKTTHTIRDNFQLFIRAGESIMLRIMMYKVLPHQQVQLLDTKRDGIIVKLFSLLSITNFLLHLCLSAMTRLLFVRFGIILHIDIKASGSRTGNSL